MRKLTLLLLLILISSCGFKIIDMSEQTNFSIDGFESKGERKINFIIKNNLLKFSKKNTNRISLELETKKTRNIKEKNIKNEITKYEILIIANATIEKKIDNTKFNISVNSNGDYSVADQNSTTRNNEKQLIKILSKNLSEKIINEINLKLNDS
jgi:outer membrane lipopolysaccharide assembly protein LptE/RlpB